MGATDPAWALQQAVHGRLAGDAALAALLGGARIYDAVPRNAAAPYVHLGEAEARDWSTATEAGAEVLFSLVVFSEAAGRREALAIAARLRALLHAASLALDGHRLVQLRHLATETEREPKDGRRARLGFRAVVEPIIP
jgi:hypothetical protein